MEDGDENICENDRKTELPLEPGTHRLKIIFLWTPPKGSKFTKQGGPVTTGGDHIPSELH